MSVYSVILAASEGEGMKTKLAKPLVCVSKKPMLSWVMDAAKEAGAKEIIVVSDHDGEEIKAFCGENATVVCGNSLVHGAEKISAAGGTALVLGADMPLILGETLKSALEEHKKEKRAATVILSDNKSGGKAWLIDLKTLKNSPDAEKVLENAVAFKADSEELLCVSDKLMLSKAEKIINRRNLEKLMLGGVTIVDPDNTYIGADVKIGMDTVVFPGTHISGNTVIGEDCEIGPNSIIESCEIGSKTVVLSSKLMESTVGTNVNIGPFAYLRPNSKIADNVKIGDFVEIKNAGIGEGTKVAHLTYIGDADVGKKVNFGCGTVVVNYDGKKKHRTVIGDNAFIGCNTNLVSPVRVNDGAYTAAGSTITEEVPKDSLAIARARQVNKENWVKDNNKL